MLADVAALKHQNRMSSKKLGMCSTVILSCTAIVVAPNLYIAPPEIAADPKKATIVAQKVIQFFEILLAHRVTQRYGFEA